MKTVLVFAGTRPEIIKMAPVIRELRRLEKNLTAWKSHFCFSGQHLEIAEPFLKFFEIKPDSQLDIMRPSQSLGKLTSLASLQLDDFFTKVENPCAALVQGDTTTAFAAGLVAFYHKIPVGHVEAGLRTKDIQEPFPEELNRRMISRLSKWNYAPTEQAKNALLKEGTYSDSILVTGNTGIDSFSWTLNQTKMATNSELKNLAGQKMVLVTVHRRENLDSRLEGILNAVKKLALNFSDIHFIFPLHPNPKVAVAREKFSQNKNILLTTPLDYPDLIWTMKNSELIMTDSGGIQEEGPSLLKPILILRDETERSEGVDYGTSFIVGSSTEKIVSVASEFLMQSRKIKVPKGPNPFGDGKAGPRIVEHLLKALALK
jgi:UDP-N-acetylglucosamine 2-epimerase (non-hydrolysing)